MRRVGFLLVCFACAGHARRAQTSLARSSRAASTASQTLLSRPDNGAAGQSSTFNLAAAFNPSRPGIPERKIRSPEGAYAPAGARASSMSVPLASQHRQRASHVMQDDVTATEDKMVQEIAKMGNMKNDTSDVMTAEEKMAQELARMENMNKEAVLKKPPQPKFLKGFDDGDVSGNDLRLAANLADPAPELMGLDTERSPKFEGAYNRNKKYYQPTKVEQGILPEKTKIDEIKGKGADGGRYFRLDGSQRAYAMVLACMVALGFGKTSTQVLDTTIIQYTQLAADALVVASLVIAIYGTFTLVSRAPDDRDENKFLWFLKLFITGPGGLQEVRRSLAE